MAGGPYFADSFYWIALGHPRDAFHVQASDWEARHRNAGIVTTEEVLTEVLNWFAARGPVGRQSVVDLVRDILADPLIRVLPQTTADFQAAISFYASRLDKEYSLVDCRSMVAMRAAGISEVLSSDHHFTQEGFTTLFP